jgi:hypothetical protein
VSCCDTPQTSRCRKIGRDRAAGKHAGGERRSGKVMARWARACLYLAGPVLACELYIYSSGTWPSLGPLHSCTALQHTQPIQCARPTLLGVWAGTDSEAAGKRSLASVTLVRCVQWDADEPYAAR